MAGLANLRIKRPVQEEVSRVLNQGRGVQITKNAGDRLVYKPTIRNSGNTVVRAQVWAQLGQITGVEPVVFFAAVTGTDGYVTVDLPPGDTVVPINVNLPLDATGPGQTFVYDCRVEIRDPNTLQPTDRWDNYDEVKIIGPAVSSVSDLSVVGMAYA